MAIIDFLPGINPFTGSRRGVTFDVSQAGPIAKKRPSPVNHQTDARMKLRAILHATNNYYWNLTNAQKAAWTAWGTANGITGPYGAAGVQRGCAAFFKVQVRARAAGDPFYIVPPGPIPLPGVTITNVVRINKDTIRVTFNPSPAGANIRVGAQQTLPTAGHAGTDCDPRWCDQYGGINTTSPWDFTPHFQHLAGWHVHYFVGSQDTFGRRSIMDRWDL